MSAYGLFEDYDTGQTIGSVYSLPKRAGKFIDYFIISSWIMESKKFAWDSIKATCQKASLIFQYPQYQKISG